jgi:DNA ligase-1
MKRFAELYYALDQTTRTSDKVELLAAYLRDTPARDAAWAVYVLTGRKIGRRVSSKLLRQCAAEASELPLWLVEESHSLVGDLSETLALLTGPSLPGSSPPPLHEIVEQVVMPLPSMTPRHQQETMRRIWSQLTPDQRLVFHKLLGGSFRVGVSKQLLVRALAEVAHVEPAVISHRLAGNWNADEPSLARLLDQTISQTSGDACLPFAFMLAHPLQEPPGTLGPRDQWMIEWKWDGIRAQIVRRAGKTALWSRGDEMIANAFPEVISCAADLPAEIVLDGELVAWHPSDSRPMPFTDLQTRLNRKFHELSFWPEVPVRFVAFDLLEHDRLDLRSETLAIRRETLEKTIRKLPADTCIKLSPLVEVTEWSELSRLIDSSRERGVEGAMLKRLDSTYQPGRHAGQWWKLKIAPYTLDAVLIAAEPGRGKRAGLLTDYTFGVWDEGELVTVAKAYSGLTDEEIARVDRICRRYTTARFGPVHQIEPRMVFELGFEAIQRSDRHKSGIALRFPRILRIRQDKKPQEADTLASIRALLQTVEAR